VLSQSTVRLKRSEKIRSWFLRVQGRNALSCWGARTLNLWLHSLRRISERCHGLNAAWKKLSYVLRYPLAVAVAQQALEIADKQENIDLATVLRASLARYQHQADVALDVVAVGVFGCDLNALRELLDGFIAMAGLRPLERV
jgi:hypothetical protein